ncbi:tyrosine-type recombinase/integrase [Butyrivibrio sp. MB2005]|uniref:tyrosine-type recombinase/integrase n=1 Tax=Butyrivibrio sp. MB2005 TaxID=1280678 RepID=UPI0003FBA38F|nr:tyrosine-type recombinase/integrase [Butyrivibrio sp. MB2005]
MERKSRSDQIESLLEEMPEFVSVFIYNFGKVDAHNTKLEYCRDIKRFLDFIVNCVPEYKKKKISVEDLTLDDLSNLDVLYINNYLTDMAENYENTTAKRRRASVASMYSYFMKAGKIRLNPMAISKRIDLPKKDVIFLTNEEQSKLLDSVRNGTGLSTTQANYHNLYTKRDSAMILLFLDTGLRVSELVSTDMDDFDLASGSVVVTRKGGDTQTVYFSNECSGYLLDYFTTQKAKFNLKQTRNFPAFTALSGERIGVRAVERLVKKYVRAALPDSSNVDKITPHKLRSSFAMSFYEATDHDILKLQKKLNHKSLNTTNIYAESAKTDMKETRNVLEGLR